MELWIFDKKRGRRSILSTSGDAHPLAPLPGADSPYQGEMSRRDKRGRDAGSAQPRLRGCRRSAGKDPNRKFSLRFGKEETSTEEKRRRLRRLVPSWSFLTRLRRPLLFRLAGKEGADPICWSAPFCGEVFCICTHQMPSPRERRGDFRRSGGFPYEGKLSPEATDEVDNAV